MSVSSRILINHLNFYVSAHPTHDKKLKKQMEALLTKMEHDIHKVYEHQTLFINNVMEKISAKIENLISLRDINIEVLKRDFTFDDPALYFSNGPPPAPHNPKANLAELLHAFKKLSERG